jgi:hypothetical protein
MDLSLLDDGFLFFTSLSWKFHAESGFNQPQNWGQPFNNWGHQGAFPKLKTSSYGCGIVS